MVRATRLSAPAAAPRTARWFLLGGLALLGAGCASESEPGVPPKAEADKSTLEKAEDKVVEGARKVEHAVGTGVEKTGEALESAGRKLETGAADSVRRNVGETAGNAVESVGKGLESAGQSTESGGAKLKENAAPK